MKKTILFRLAATLPVLMFFISSCSKDALTKQEEKQTANAQTTGKGIRGGGSESPGTAQIEAVLMPERAQPAARLFSPDYIGAEKVFDQNGYIHFDGLAEGNYTIWIYARVPGFLSKRITDIVVLDGQVTDLGTITLDPDPDVDY
jgi:hypothetical protein